MSRKRRARHRPQSPPRPRTVPALAPVSPWPRTLYWAPALFVSSFAVRLLFWRATADAGRPDSAYFKGDALLWLEYARALLTRHPFELGLPVHPPGTAYLLALLWNGEASGLAWLKLVWCALGALAVTLAALAMERAFGPGVGRVAGIIMTASTGLLILSTSLNSETPYLVLLAVSFCLFPGLLDAPRAAALAAWAALNGVACLFRVEHVLFVILTLAFLAVRWRPWKRLLSFVMLAVAAFLLPLVPWHVKAWGAIERFNTEAPALTPALRRDAERLAWMPWDDAARARRDALPAFARDTVATFVAATVAHRGGSRVRAEDFGTLVDAFGYEPRPLGTRPFVSLYGPLNFALANHPRATGGFGTAALEVPPPLLPRRDAYPDELVRGLPPPELAFTYPPYLAFLNRGYALGGQWIRAEPGRALRLLAAKLERFWAGASMGLTGFGLPLGIEGTRYAVDMTVPTEGWSARAWRLALLAACALGASAGGCRPALYPWLFHLATKALTAALFFGYARLGASTIPVVALLLALAAERWSGGALSARLRGRLLLAALLVVVGVEAARYEQRPVLLLDGRAAGPMDPFPPDDHRDHRLGLAR